MEFSWQFPKEIQITFDVSFNVVAIGCRITSSKSVNRYVGDIGSVIRGLPF